jgi:hypothetical protein
MSWSYDNTDLGTDTAAGRLNAVRLLIGDTTTADQQVQDEEIVFALAQGSDSIYSAGSWMAKSLASKYARYVDVDLDGQLSESYSQLQSHYNSLAESLSQKAKTYGSALGVAAGGLVESRIKRDQFREDPLVSYEEP